MGTQAGLVLRSKSVEIYEAEAGQGGVRFIRALSVPVADPQRNSDMVAAIQQAFSNARLKTNRLAVCVAGQDVLLRSFTLPMLPKSEWQSAIQFEARKHIPFRTEDLAWDFHTSERRATRQLDIVFVGIRSETFGQIQQWLKAANVIPTCIEPQSVSLARLTAAPQKGRPDQVVGLVDVEQTVAHLVFAKDQVPSFIRDVSLVAEPSIPATDVPTVEPGSRLPVEPPVVEVTAPDPRAALLLNELRVSLDFFMRENPTLSVSRLQVFSHDAAVVAWCPWLAKELSVPVEPGELPIKRGGQLVASGFGCAAGLALRDQRQARVKMNLLGRSVAAPASSKLKGLESLLKFGGTHPAAVAGKPDSRSIVIQVVVALVLLIIWKGIATQQLSAAKSRQEMMIRNFADVGWGLKGKQKADLQTLQDQMDKRVSMMKKTIEQRISTSSKLAVVAKALPEGVWLENVSYSNKLDLDKGGGQAQLMIEGACYLRGANAEMAAISDFASRLRQDTRMTADLPRTQLGEIASTVDRTTETPYKTFRVECATVKQ